MAKAVTNIKNFVKSCKVLPADISILVRGPHGIGKSEIVEQLANHFRETEFNGEDFPLYDKRMSQMDAGDIIGLPIMDGTTTNFCPPNWYKACCDAPAMLFLDEVNRATHEVMQAVFQIILNRELNGHKLHPQTRVFAAVNTGASYVINEMDPALLDRFWCVDLEPDTDEWFDWATKNPDMIPWVVDFLKVNQIFLDPPKDVDPGSVTQSRRSWHRLCRTLRTANLHELPDDPKNLSPDVYTLSLGFLGVECSIAFTEWVRNMNRQITGDDIINKLVKKAGKVEPKYIGNPKLLEENPPQDDYTYDSKILKSLEELGQERMVALSEKVTDCVKEEFKTNNKLSKKQGAGLGKFFSMLPHEIRMAMFTNLTKDGADNIPFIKEIHKWIIAHVTIVFGVPLDSDGSIEPTVPSFLNNK